jgi:hypothetical protein
MQANPKLIANKDSCAMAKETLLQYFSRGVIAEMKDIDEREMCHLGTVSSEQAQASVTRALSRSVEVDSADDDSDDADCRRR